MIALIVTIALVGLYVLNALGLCHLGALGQVKL